MKPKRMSFHVEGSAYMNEHIIVERSACSFVRWGSYSYVFHFGSSYPLCVYCTPHSSRKSVRRATFCSDQAFSVTYGSVKVPFYLTT